MGYNYEGNYAFFGSRQTWQIDTFDGFVCVFTCFETISENYTAAIWISSTLDLKACIAEIAGYQNDITGWN